MKTMMLLFALSFAAAAQTLSTVTLAGDATDPVIVNHSGKSIIAAMIRLTHANGQTEIHRRYFVHGKDLLPDGASLRIGADKHTLKTSSPRTASKLLAVILADGEYRGEDAYQFQKDAEAEFASMRRAFALARAGDWVGLKSLSESTEPSNFMSGSSAAEYILYAHNHGVNIESLSYYGNLPASTWKSGAPLAKLFTFPKGILQAFIDWIQPTAYAQSSITNVQPYDLTEAHCDSGPFRTVPPCPPLQGATPFVGLKGSCGGYPPLTVGIAVNVGVDYQYIKIDQYSYALTNQLRSYGKCANTYMQIVFEKYQYHIDCTNVIVMDYDNTEAGDLCGAGAGQYPFVP